MAGQARAGRNMKIEKGGVPLAGIRTKSFSIENEAIDITDDDDSGIRTLLETVAGGTLEVASKQVTVTFDGITKDDELIKAAAQGLTLVNEYDLILASGAKITGDFALTATNLSGEYQGATQFDGELQSTGPWVWTDAP